MGIYTVFNIKLKPNKEMINFRDDLLSHNGVYNLITLQQTTDIHQLVNYTT